MTNPQVDIMCFKRLDYMLKILLTTPGPLINIILGGLIWASKKKENLHFDND